MDQAQIQQQQNNQQQQQVAQQQQQPQQPLVAPVNQLANNVPIVQAQVVQGVDGGMLWTIIRPFFKEEFTTESDDKLILDGLAHTAMCPMENVRDFFGRLNNVNTVILDAYQGYTLAPQDPFQMPMATSR